MRFLLRAAFWLGVVAVLLPAVTKSPSDSPQSAVSAADAASAASAAVADMRQFCSRQPDACAVGSQFATAIGQMAQVGAKMLYGIVNDAFADHPAPVTTGSTGERGEGAARTLASQHTLTPTDVTPEWRGPAAPRRDSPKRPAG